MSTRSASTVSGTTQAAHDEFESADTAVSGIKKKNINENESSYWGFHPAHMSRQGIFQFMMNILYFFMPVEIHEGSQYPSIDLFLCSECMCSDLITYDCLRFH